MTVFVNSDHLYANLKEVFNQVGQDSQAVEAVAATNMIFRLRLTSPNADVTLNCRKKPIKILYGRNSLIPDLVVEMEADTLHQILLGELPLGKASASGRLRMRGPFWNVKDLEPIFHSCQRIYPAMLSDMDSDGANQRPLLM